MPKYQKKLNPEKNFKIEGFFGNMAKDSKKIENIEKPEDKKITKNKKEKINLTEEEKKEEKREKSKPKKISLKNDIKEKEEQKKEKEKSNINNKNNKKKKLIKKKLFQIVIHLII